jgi:type VI protein secretion system component Hcp
MGKHLLFCLVVGGWLSACGQADGLDSPTDVDPVTRVNPLEAAGRVDFFVRVVGADGMPFTGESSSVRFQDFIPAIRFFSNVSKPPAGVVRCNAIQFTKAAGAASPLFARAVSSGEILRSVRFDFVRPPNDFVWQRLDVTSVRVATLEQAVAPPEGMSPSALLEEVNLEPVNTAGVTLTAFPLRADGTAGPPVTTSYTCRR